MDADKVVIGDMSAAIKQYAEQNVEPLPVCSNSLLDRPSIGRLMEQREAAMREYQRLDKELWFAMKAKINESNV